MLDAEAFELKRKIIMSQKALERNPNSQAAKNMIDKCLDKLFLLTRTKDSHKEEDSK